MFNPAICGVGWLMYYIITKWVQALFKAGPKKKRISPALQWYYQHQYNCILGWSTTSHNITKKCKEADTQRHISYIQNGQYRQLTLVKNYFILTYVLQFPLSIEIQLTYRVIIIVDIFIIITLYCMQFSNYSGKWKHKFHT